MISDRPLRDPFQSEVILVQNSRMAQWMQMKLAEHFSIAANIEFPFPARFIWKIFTRVLSDIPAEQIFSKSAITWRLMLILPRICHQEGFELICQYISNDKDKRKSFQFAERVADLFSRYLVYRPDWLNSWQSGGEVKGLADSQRWQASLWRALMEDMKGVGQPVWHYANLYERFIQVLERTSTLPVKLPERMFIFGVSRLPPTYLQVLQALGRHMDIHLLFTNPCRYYWGEIYNYTFLVHLMHRTRRHYQEPSNRMLFRTPEQASALFNCQSTLNPLLASWGNLGRDHLYLLSQLKGIQEVDAFIEPIGDCLLRLLQRDILELENHAVIALDGERLNDRRRRRVLQPEDRSLSLHVCHSPQREVEVLHDSLLAMLADDPSLTVRDIIVMAADIERYTPAIQAVFGNTAGRYLPFTIFDRQIRHVHPVLSAFLNLLELPRNRFSAEQVLSLLEVPALAARFNINEEGFKLLRQWVAESGIRWGLDDDTLRALNLPVTGQHTWYFGLTRMLLGYAMSSRSGDWKGFLPYDEVSGQVASLVGHLAEFLIQLQRWRDRLAQPRTLEGWLTSGREIIDDFFAPDFEAKEALGLLESDWCQLLQCGLQAGYNQPVPVTLLHDEMSARLEQKRISQPFFAGTIHFCTLMPISFIPFKVVCLLGMNDDVYPRTLPLVSFDLMLQKRRCGDHSRRDDDRYLILEMLLSAQQKLYISFIGRAIQDNTLRYPSVFVSELCEYIAQSFCLPGDELIDAEISSLRVRTHL